MSPLINIGRFARDINLPESILAWLDSPDFVRLVLALDDDRTLRTQLLTHMLQHIALDATYGQRLEDFMFADGSSVCVVFNLHRCHNFLGTTVTLDQESDEYRCLADAMKANLASHKFKAASMMLRMREATTKRRFFPRARERAEEFVRRSEEARRAAEPTAKPLSEGSVRSEACQIAHKASEANARHRWARIAAIDAHCVDDLMRGSQNEIMLKFALRYMAPEPLEAVAADALNTLTTA